MYIFRDACIFGPSIQTSALNYDTLTLPWLLVCAPCPETMRLMLTCVECRIRDDTLLERGLTGRGLRWNLGWALLRDDQCMQASRVSIYQNRFTGLVVANYLPTKSVAAGWRYVTFSKFIPSLLAKLGSTFSSPVLHSSFVTWTSSFIDEAQFFIDTSEKENLEQSHIVIPSEPLPRRALGSLKSIPSTVAGVMTHVCICKTLN